MGAIIFDFDGLIVDTESPEVEVWKALFTRHGVSLPDSWWSNAIGRGHDQQQIHPADLLIQTTGKNLNRESLIEEGHAMRTEIVRQMPLLPGVRNLIEEAETLGIKLGLASSSRHTWVDPLLELHQLTKKFAIVACAEDVKQTKPAPDLYLLACNKLNIPPKQALALEDSPPGIHSAKQAGLTAIAVPNPFTAQLDLSEADAVFDSLLQFKLQEFIHVFK